MTNKPKIGVVALDDKVRIDELAKEHDIALVKDKPSETLWLPFFLTAGSHLGGLFWSGGRGRTKVKPQPPQDKGVARALLTKAEAKRQRKADKRRNNWQYAKTNDEEIY